VFDHVEGDGLQNPGQVGVRIAFTEPVDQAQSMNRISDGRSPDQADTFCVDGGHAMLQNLLTSPRRGLFLLTIIDNSIWFFSKNQLIDAIPKPKTYVFSISECMKGKLMKVEISIGGLVDRVSILSIKLSRIKDPEKLKNIRIEYDMLVVAMRQVGIEVNDSIFGQLRDINLKLWDIENGLRSKEAKKEFDDEFVELARSVYINNDERAALKRKISVDFGSAIIEENEYSHYQNIPYSFDARLLRASVR
jgi:hypothetical protein